ncbi:DUF7927 domain-containing protein [Flaviflexus equikiangi]|uniref:DUF11 domain-containing protein n=1 Tax=Flaviflexus equikiangi TaxID=2758573 RepID=A0ABS2THX4_9ACTO|nr:SpaA isopeptide-forming pilin-related protein [Flaviflexus equikiangi]MBM9433953.1 DUF11 domain-containing protein [Flaviflexus equikiangi]
MLTMFRSNVALGLVFALSLLTGVMPSQAQQNVDVDPTIVVSDETIEPAENEQPVDEPTSDELSQAESEEPVSEPASDEISSEPEGSAILSEPEGPEDSSASVSTGDVEAGLFALPTGRNYLTWKVTDAGGIPVGGSTVTVGGPRAGPTSWTTGTANVADCTVDPCHPSSMDQNPAPGVFAVPFLIREGESYATRHDISANSRYRIRPVGSINGYGWTTSTATWIEIPGSGNSPSGWPTNGPWVFTDLKVAPRSQTNICTAATNEYYTLRRNSSTSSSTAILKATHNAAETAINTTTTQVPNSSVTLSANQTGNALGVTPTGIFYFAGQDANGRNVTTYRFDPSVDAAPYPVFTMDMLSPTAGYVVAGDATIYQGREEFYYAYFSSSNENINGRSALRMHVYRYSAGNGDRTGEVAHVDVERPANFTTNANEMNGDFAFDGANNLQFIMSDTNGGYTVSGSVEGVALQQIPGSHTLAEVPTIIGSANAGRLPNGQREAVNGVTYTQSGRAIIQQGALNSFADPTSMNILSSRTTLSGGGAFVDLASCAEPTTISVQKYVDGDRFQAGDQFVLNAARTAGGTTTPFTSATTTGNEQGLQKEQIGPFAMIFDGTFTASETISQNAGSYQTTWACYVGGSQTPFIDGSGRSLSFELNTTTSTQLVPGENINCIFTNKALTPNLSVDKSSSPESGTTVNPDGIVTYTLTFDNTSGTAAATVNHVDHLKDVLDDAVFVNGTDVVPAPVITASGTPPLTTSWDATSQQLAITGIVPVGEVRTISFPVRVKANADNAAARENADQPLAGYWMRNYVTPAGENPPATCEDDSALCTQHPIPAWTVSKDSLPADDSLVHSGDTVHYRVTVSKLNGGAGNWALDDVVVTDDMTDVLKVGSWAPDAEIRSGALPIGIYLYDSAGNRQTHCTEETSCVTDPVLQAGGGTAPYFDSTWTLTTSEFDMPANIVRAEVWYSVTVGNAPTIDGQWEPEEIQWGTTFLNAATADSTSQPPQQCETGVPGSFNSDECQVEHRIQNGFFTIRKDGVSVDGVEQGLSGHAFEIRDDSGGTMSAAVPAAMCTEQNWIDAGFTGTVPTVPWNVDPSDYPGSPTDCAYLYATDSPAQQGAWRSQNLPAGTYWLLETRAPADHQLLAEPVKFTVADADGEGRLTVYDREGNPAETCGSDGVACVDGDGWLMIIQDPRMIALPLTGGLGINALLSGSALIIIITAVGAGLFIRRRNSVSS